MTTTKASGGVAAALKEPGIEAGAVRDLCPGIRRVTAPNPGVMTGPGTNTYLVGEREVAVIDPGPAHQGHLETVLGASGRKIRWILVTHTHPDHSPGAAFLKAATRAEVIGLRPPRGGSQDQSFAPDRVMDDGELIQAGEFSLRAVHTPGHASNHLCFLHEEEQLLFTGDHIKQDSTVVIAPPDGDMAVYLDSLRRLLALPMKGLAPGHGKLMGEPRKVVEWFIAHRLAREEKVMGSLLGFEVATPEDLLPLVYDDVPSFLHPVAIHSLRAHLIKLERDGRVSLREGRWQALSGRVT